MYRPATKAPIKTDYVPKHASVGFDKKKFKAPKQPVGLTLSSANLGSYISKIISSFDGTNKDEILYSYRYVFDQIKILIRSIMGVLCDQEYKIDIALFKAIGQENEPGGVVIRFPEEKYVMEKWIYIMRSLIPSGITLPYDEDWFDIYIYIYQNIMLTISAKMRENKEQLFKEMLLNTEDEAARNDVRDMRRNALASLKNSVYEWIDFTGDYIKKTSYQNPLTSTDPSVKLIWGAISLQYDSIDFSPFIPGIDIAECVKMLNMKEKRAQEEYLHVMEILRNYENENKKLAITLSDLVEAMMWYHYGGEVEKVMFDDKVREIVHAFCFEKIKPVENRIRLAMNTIHPETYAKTIDLLKTYNRQCVIEIIKKYATAQPQLFHVVKAMAELGISEEVMRNEQIGCKCKFDENYHKTVAYAILTGIYTVGIITDDEVVPEKNRLAVITELLAEGLKYDSLKLSTVAEYAKEIGDQLVDKASKYDKFRYQDAIDGLDSQK